MKPLPPPVDPVYNPAREVNPMPANQNELPADEALAEAAAARVVERARAVSRAATPIAGAANSKSDDRGDMPATLTVGEQEYRWVPMLHGYYGTDGSELDMRTREARTAVVAALAKVNPAEKRPEPPAQDVHRYRVDADTLAAYQRGRRWAPLDKLQPGTAGEDGVQRAHSVNVTHEVPDGASVSLAYNVVEVDYAAGIASLEPGERVGTHALVVSLKGHHLDWVHRQARREGMTVERFMRRLVGAAYAVDPDRGATMPGGGFSGRANASNPAAVEARAARGT